MRASVLRLGLATAGVTALVAGAVVVGGPAQASGRDAGTTKAAAAHGKGSTSFTVQAGPDDVVAIGCTTMSADGDGASVAPIPAGTASPAEVMTTKPMKATKVAKPVKGAKVLEGVPVEVTADAVTGTVVAGGTAVAQTSTGEGGTADEGGPQVTPSEDGSFVVEVPAGMECSPAS